MTKFTSQDGDEVVSKEIDRDTYEVHGSGHAPLRLRDVYLIANVAVPDGRTLPISKSECSSEKCRNDTEHMHVAELISACGCVGVGLDVAIDLHTGALHARCAGCGKHLGRIAVAL